MKYSGVLNFKVFLLLISSLSVISLLVTSFRTEKKSVINENEYRDKVYACWLGKNIGGTLGMPFEGKKEINNVTFYTKLKEGEPAANDDLDLQILWLKAMEENNYHVDAYTLGEYWLKYVPVNWNEYGVGKANMKLGIMPPLSGEYNNAKWKTSNGAWIRSEIWACLAPGNPMLAAEFAWNDACVDHGCAEGTFAEIFTATLESAAFVENDRDKLINFGLSAIPPDCKTALAIRTAIKAWQEKQTWEEARETVVKATEDLGWFQAPRNVAFTIIGWLYGEGDFGKSICIAINCGDDTDCTGATLGSILGIIHGTSIIPEKWRKPIGDGIKSVAVTGFDIPPTLQVLTEKTIAAQKKVAALYQSPLVLNSGKTRIVSKSDHLKTDAKKLKEIWTRSPFKISRNTENIAVTCDYTGYPVIETGKPLEIKFSISNKTGKQRNISVDFKNVPEGYSLTGKPGSFVLGPSAVRDFTVIVHAPAEVSNTGFMTEITDEKEILNMQIAVLKKL